jgi:hypothetical protein
MRENKPHTQGLLQIPIQFCSGLSVYFGWPNVGLLQPGNKTSVVIK